VKDGPPLSGELADPALVPVENFLLEDFRVWPGKVFAALKAHPVAADIQVSSFFFFAPAAGGNLSEIVIQPVSQAVIQQLFTGALEEGRSRSAFRFAVAVKVLGIKTGGPFIGFEEADNAAIAAGRHQRDDLGGGENIFFSYFQCVFIHVIIHTIPVLMPSEISQLFKEVHQGSGDPEPVCAGDDKIIDICFLVRATFGQRP